MRQFHIKLSLAMVCAIEAVFFFMFDKRRFKFENKEIHCILLVSPRIEHTYVCVCR